MTNFDTCITRLLPIEGGYVNDPADPGGETKYGICKRTYPDEDIKNLTPERAAALYKRDFWDVVHGDDLPLVIADQLLDFAVNSSPETAIRKGQEAVGVVDDGHWGPITQDTMRFVQPGIFTAKFAARKIRYYTSLKADKFLRYGAGWMNRIATDLDYAAGDMV